PARRAISSTWAFTPSSEKTASAAARTSARLRRASARIMRAAGSTSETAASGGVITGTMVPIVAGIRNRGSGCDGRGSARGLGLLDRELGRGVGAQPLVGDRIAAAHRTSERPVGESLLGAGDGGETITQARGDGVVDLLAAQARCRVGEVAV